MFRSIRDFKTRYMIQNTRKLSLKLLSNIWIILSSNKIQLLQKQQIVCYFVKYLDNKRKKTEFYFSVFYVFSQKIRKYELPSTGLPTLQHHKPRDFSKKNSKGQKIVAHHFVCSDRLKELLNKSEYSTWILSIPNKKRLLSALRVLTNEDYFFFAQNCFNPSELKHFILKN